MEVMGRDAGFIALHSGVAGTADVILIPEIPYDIEKVCEKIMSRDRAGRHFSIVVVAEGAFPKGGHVSMLGESLPGEARRFGGLCEPIAREIQELTGKETRSLVLGHLQRGGMPTGYDRLARDALRRRGGAGGGGREVGAHGGAAVAAHRDDSDRGGSARAEARRPDARHRFSRRARRGSASETDID